MNIDILEGPPMKDEKSEAEEKEAQKEEKRLRDGHKKAEIAEKLDEGDTVYLAVTGEKAGNCTFAGAYNEAWDWKAEAENQNPDGKFFKFNLTVSEAAKESKGGKAEEKTA